jgi:hypothetical protein
MSLGEWLGEYLFGIETMQWYAKQRREYSLLTHPEDLDDKLSNSLKNQVELFLACKFAPTLVSAVSAYFVVYTQEPKFAIGVFAAEAFRVYSACGEREYKKFNEELRKHMSPWRHAVPRQPWEQPENWWK